MLFPGIAKFDAALAVGFDVEEDNEGLSMAAAEAVGMLEGPNTATSVGAAAAEVATEEDTVVAEEDGEVVCVTDGIVVARLAPMTDTSVGATGPEVGTADEEDWLAGTVESVGVALSEELGASVAVAEFTC